MLRTLAPLLLVNTLSVGSVMAGTLDAQTLFSAGDYRGALSQYLKLSEQQPASRQLNYNIAVCYYKLGDWESANQKFRELHQSSPDDANITYSLAVTEKKLGNRQEAARLFADIYQDSSDDQLAALALKQHQGLSKNKISQYRSAKSWSADINLNFGREENIIDPENEQNTEETDHYSEALVSARWSSDPSDRLNAWTFEGTGLFSQYQTFSDYDINLFYASLGKSNATDFGYWKWNTRAEHTTLGGDDYLQVFTLQGRTGGNFNNGAAWALIYQMKDINSQDEQYQHLDGSAYRLEASYRNRITEDLSWKLAYRVDRDDRDDLTDLDDFYSYSALRHGVLLQSNYLMGRWALIGRLSYRDSEYDDEHSIDGIQTLREDERTKVSLRVEREIGRKWLIALDYSYTDNRSTLEQYVYDRGILSLGAGLQF